LAAFTPASSANRSEEIVEEARTEADETRREADAYAAEHASADALASALVRLYEDNASTLTPDPVHSRFYDSHPPAVERLAHLERLRGTAQPAGA